MMLQAQAPDDFVIATGESFSLEEFVSVVFDLLGLDWERYVQVDRQLYRPTDLMEGRASSKKAFEKLGWKARSKMPEVARMMVDAEMSGYPREESRDARSAFVASGEASSASA